MSPAPALSRRSYSHLVEASSWEEIWEAGPYYDRVSELLEHARYFMVFVGWQIDSRLPLRRPTDQAGMPGKLEGFRDKILRLCADKSNLQAYFLIWNHAPLYLIERELWQTRIWEEIHPRIHFVFDNRHPVGASHHEKICLIDGKVAFCGGIDFCDDRWDSPEHLFEDPRRSLDWKSECHGPYHDLAVQLTGPVYAPIHEHVQRRWEALSAIPFPKISSSQGQSQGRTQGRGHRVYLSRTLVTNENKTRIPIVREIEFLFRELVRRARSQIIIEGQYYWSSELNDLLIAKMREMRGRDFRVILILSELKTSKSFTKNMARHQLELLRQLQTAAEENGTLLSMGVPYVMKNSGQAGDQALAKPIYVHSKVLIIDDQYLSIGSANLATRALRVDTELGVTLEATRASERAHIRRVSEAILRHWGIGSPGESRGGVFLRPIRPVLELAHMQEIKWRAPWRPLFDPRLPWFHPFKRRARRAMGAPHSTQWLLTQWLIASLASLTTVLVLAPFGMASFARNAAWGVLFAAVGVVPIPFFLLSAIATIHLGRSSAFTIATTALICTAMVRYAFERTFPARLQTRGLHTRLQSRLGRRSLRMTLLAALDPRDGVHRKITAFGQYCIPLPWFLTCIAFVFPMVLALVILAAEKLAIFLGIL